MLFAGCTNRIMQPSSRPDAHFGSFATKPAGSACRSMSAFLQKRPDCFARAKCRDGPLAEILIYAACAEMAGFCSTKSGYVSISFMTFFRAPMAKLTLAHRFRRAHACEAISQELTEDATMSTMSRVKQASKRKRTTKAAAVEKVLGVAGLSFSLVNSAAASTVPTFSIPRSDNTSPNQRFVLSEEEMADVSLATFYVFDRENIGGGVQLARGGCAGCRGCGGCGGFRGCGGGVGFGCRGCGGCRGCVGLGLGLGLGLGGLWWGGCGCGYAGWGYGWGSCCASWGACRWC